MADCDDHSIFRSLLVCSAQVESPYTGNGTDGTRGAGIIRRPGPRTGPRPLVPELAGLGRVLTTIEIWPIETVRMLRTP